MVPMAAKVYGPACGRNVTMGKFRPILLKKSVFCSLSDFNASVLEAFVSLC